MWNLFVEHFGDSTNYKVFDQIIYKYFYFYLIKTIYMIATLQISQMIISQYRSNILALTTYSQLV